MQEYEFDSISSCHLSRCISCNSIARMWQSHLIPHPEAAVPVPESAKCRTTIVMIETTCGGHLSYKLTINNNLQCFGLPITLCWDQRKFLCLLGRNRKSAKALLRVLLTKRLRPKGWGSQTVQQFRVHSSGANYPNRYEGNLVQ
jgi:hypothetical protein